MYDHPYSNIMARSETVKFLKQCAAEKGMKIVDLMDQLANSLGPIPVISDVPPPYSVPRVASIHMSSEETLPPAEPFKLSTKVYDPLTEPPIKLPPMDEWGNEVQQTPNPPAGPSPARARLDKIAKSLKPDTKRCPHGIASGGYCKGCGGFAK